jgi:glycerol-3-phosphate acyltransferase PlsY
MSPTPSLPDILAATGIAYLVGSIPIAFLVARVQGIDIYRVGTGQAGTTNVWREVGRWSAAVVFFSDSAKGLGAMLAARALGLHSEFLLVPAFAVVLAHWNSPWAGFRGGDGVAPLTGIGLGYAPAALGVPYAVVAVASPLLIGRVRHPTMWSAIAAYIVFLGVSFVPAMRLSPVETIGFTGLGVAILVHSYVYRRRRKGKLAGALLEAVQEEDVQLPDTGTVTPPETQEQLKDRRA